MVEIKRAFDGARVLVTGATGFLGTAVVAKCLSSLPVAELLLLVRSKPGAPAAERVRRRVLGSNAFDSLRSLDGWDDLASRVSAVDGDMRSDKLGLEPGDLERLRGVDIVVHSAATVSFDAPVDEAFETNLAGPLRLLDALDAAGADPRRIVHVSTAYVSGLARGVAAEAPWTDLPGRPRMDWRAELEVWRTARPRTEEESRTPELIKRFLRDARREVGPAGAPAVANRAEQLRRDWVNDRLVEMGRTRAQALGWPDAYAFTKALAETAVLERAAGSRPLTILRPSIIESALREPFPGWIRGFRMADPVIIAYGRGQLAEFPGLPDTVTDVVPVDMVVNAILATAAADDPPAVIHVCTGNRNPMRYRELVAYTHEFFQQHPYTDEDGQPIFPDRLTFPGRRRVESRLRLARRALRTTSRVLDHLPASRVGDVATRVETRLDDLDQAAKYAELYGAYAEVQTIFDDTRAGQLLEGLSPADRAAFDFDPMLVNWRSYLHDIHLPEVTRRRSAVRRRPRELPVSAAPVPGPLRRGGSAPPNPPASRALAVFDLEGTVLGTNVVDTYLWIRLAASPRSEWARRAAHLAGRIPQYLITDRRDRGQFLRTFYRRYEGGPVDELARLAQDAFNTFVLPRCFPEAIRRIRDHRTAGHRVVFLTGALDFTVAPLSALADEVSAARLEIRDGRYTGDLIDVPLAGDSRATYLRRLAERMDADLRSSYAYGDSISDLPMLESVGHPVAVNPDGRLARVARNRRWPVERWTIEAGARRFPLPELVS
jgi:HAD superfamily hydrolase (TIGR01490 family)